MVIMARSKSIDGLWQDDPNNPVVKTWSTEEKWWSRGHATLFEGPDKKWWMIYHGYENGYWTLGRQTLLEPVAWTDDGWIKPLGGDLSAPLEKPVERGPQPHGQALSDDFSTDRLGTLWAFYDPAPGEDGRLRRADSKLHMAGKGATPGDSSPLCCIVGDQAYEVEVDVEIDAATEAGLVLFYNRRLYAGLGITVEGLMMHRYGLQRPLGTTPGQRIDPTTESTQRRMRIRLRNDRNILTIHTSADAGRSWQKFGVQMEVSGYHHNVAYDFLSLRPAIYSAGRGTATFSNFIYRGLM
jgi:beta-xylosidase